MQIYKIIPLLFSYTVLLVFLLPKVLKFHNRRRKAIADKLTIIIPGRNFYKYRIRFIKGGASIATICSLIEDILPSIKAALSMIQGSTFKLDPVLDCLFLVFIIVASVIVYAMIEVEIILADEDIFIDKFDHIKKNQIIECNIDKQKMVVSGIYLRTSKPNSQKLGFDINKKQYKVDYRIFQKVVAYFENNFASLLNKDENL